MSLNIFQIFHHVSSPAYRFGESVKPSYNEFNFLVILLNFHREKFGKISKTLKRFVEASKLTNICSQLFFLNQTFVIKNYLFYIEKLKMKFFALNVSQRNDDIN